MGKMLHVERGYSGFCRCVHMIFGHGLVSSRVEDVACRERLVCVLYTCAYDLWARACFFTCGSVHMIFGQGLVSSRVEDVHVERG